MLDPVAEFKALLVRYDAAIAKRDAASLGGVENPILITQKHFEGLPENLADTDVLKAILLEKLRGQPVVNKFNGTAIIFTRDALGSSLKNRNPLARKMYLALPEILEHAVPMGSEDNTKEHKIGIIERYDFYHAHVRMDDELYQVSLKVEVPVRAESDRWKKDDRYYYHSVHGVKKIG